MEVKFRVNLDFDSALSHNDPSYQNSKFLNELEYIFFLANRDNDAVLYTTNHYSEKYLNHLRSFGFTIASLSSDQTNYKNWWGNLSNFEEARKLNSKCWLASWHKPLGDKIIESRNDLEDRFPSYYRADQGFSGISNHILNSQSDFKKLKFPGVQSQYVQVLQTFGVTYNLKTNEYFIVENITDKKGAFKGGSLINISELMPVFDLEAIINELNIHAPEAEVIQFDNMIYLDEIGERKICPLVEINYRRTMGSIIKSVTEILGKGSLHFGDRDKLRDDSIILSPDFVRNICFYNRA